MQVALRYTHHLVQLIEDFALTAGRLADVPRDRREELRCDARREAALRSARLDGSPLEPATVEAVNTGNWRRPAALTATPRAGGWAGALRLDTMNTDEVAAVEYDNLLRVSAREGDLAAGFFDDPSATLAQVHGLVCEGLVEPEAVGRYRRTVQAVHDGAQGKVLFNTADPDTVPGLMQSLERWLRGDRGADSSAMYAAPVVAAVVHERLLQWQPFEAANGRVARAASRLVLLARGFDVGGLAVPERVWGADPVGYYGEVAATIRRREDLTPWVERHTQALVTAASAAAVALDRMARPAPRALAAVSALPAGDTITVDDYAARLGVPHEIAWGDLRLLAANGYVQQDSRTQGRRYRRL